MKYANVKANYGPIDKRRTYNRMLTEAFNRYLDENPKVLRDLENQCQQELVKIFAKAATDNDASSSHPI